MQFFGSRFLGIFGARTAALGAAALVLGGCALYKVDVAQGNLITAEMKQQLQLGMTQRQVRFLLGSPMVQDAFHPERWDYVYVLRRGNGDTTQEQLRLTFDGDRLKQVSPPLTGVSGG